jgi:hypothetical protein
VTLNLDDFPVDACEPFAIEALHPDLFLVDLYGLDPVRVFAAVEAQAALHKRPPMTTNDLLARLEFTVPHFAPCAATPGRHLPEHGLHGRDTR